MEKNGFQNSSLSCDLVKSDLVNSGVGNVENEVI